MRHLKSTFVIYVSVTVDLIDLIVHQRLRDHAVHPYHVCGREFMRIEFASIAEQNQFSIVPFQ